jgi:hypothetical protein
MMAEQSARRLYQVRGKLYELLANCIPPELLLRTLLVELLAKLDDEIKVGRAGGGLVGKAGRRTVARRGDRQRTRRAAGGAAPPHPRGAPAPSRRRATSRGSPPTTSTGCRRGRRPSSTWRPLWRSSCRDTRRGRYVQGSGGRAGRGGEGRAALLSRGVWPQRGGAWRGGADLSRPPFAASRPAAPPAAPLRPVPQAMALG